MHVDVAGNIVNSIAMECLDGSIERRRFSNGVRYVLRSAYDGSEIHVVGKDNTVFIEIWDASRYALPLVILRYKAVALNISRATRMACYAHNILIGRTNNSIDVAKAVV